MEFKSILLIDIVLTSKKVLFCTSTLPKRQYFAHKSIYEAPLIYYNLIYVYPPTLSFKVP